MVIKIVRVVSGTEILKTYVLLATDHRVIAKMADEATSRTVKPPAAVDSPAPLFLLSLACAFLAPDEPEGDVVDDPVFEAEPAEPEPDTEADDPLDEALAPTEASSWDGESEFEALI